MTRVQPRPGRLRSPGNWRGLVAVLQAGFMWAILSGILAALGHRPAHSFFGAERHFALQAVWVVPVLLVMWWLGSRAARPTPATPDRRFVQTWGLAMAAPLVALLLVPELILLAGVGLEAVTIAARFTLPAAALAMWFLGALAIRSHARWPWGPSLGRAARGMAVQLPLALIFLR